MNATDIKRLLRTAALVIESAAAAAYSGGIMTQRESALSSLPLWVYPNKTSLSCTVHSRDGDEQADLFLEYGTLRIKTENGGEYISDNEWVVADCFVSDIDHDGFDEVMLHVWKKGSFGEYQPFWMEKEEKISYSEHLFIYDWRMSRPNRLEAMWMSSEIPVKGERITVDEKGRVSILSPNGKTTVWSWGGWGLALIEEYSMEG